MVFCMWGMRLGLPLLGAIMLLAGCAPAGTTAEEAADWEASQGANADSTPRMTAYLSATTGEDADAEPGEGVTLDFSEPRAIDAIRFDCMGPATMTVQVEIEAASGTQQFTFDDQSCEATQVDLGVPAVDGVTSIRIDGESEANGAWIAILQHP